MPKITQPNDEVLAADISNALVEDIGSGDLSAMLLPQNVKMRAKLRTNETMILCGIPWVNGVFHRLDHGISINWYHHEGDMITSGSCLAELHGRGSAMLSAERTALNFLQTLSAVATVTKTYCDLISHTKARIRDTRKTIPGLRAAQKYAVRVGGGLNHRMGLYDEVLLKENHLRATGSIRNAMEMMKQFHGDQIKVEIEVENLHELQTALECGANRILLDNFNLSMVKQAVALNADRAELEASGNINLTNIVEIAEAGVDYISIGALTKNVSAVDLSLRFDSPENS